MRMMTDADHTDDSADSQNTDVQYCSSYVMMTPLNTRKSMHVIATVAELGPSLIQYFDKTADIWSSIVTRHAK